MSSSSLGSFSSAQATPISPSVQDILGASFGIADNTQTSVNQTVARQLEAIQQQQDAQAHTRSQVKSQQQLDSLYARLSKEEHEVVLQKMQEFVQLPAGHLKKEDELYLEQQLSDMFGFEVAVELEGHRLNHSVGRMESLPHLRRHPGDTLSAHDAYREAGLAEKRGGFGWFTQMGQLNEGAIQDEKYYIAAQVSFVSAWNAQYATLKKWFAFRKVLVINPAEQKAVVAVIGDIGPRDWLQKQFGGSPEVIREAEIWTPKSKGRVLVLFVNELDQRIPLGPIDLAFEQMTLEKDSS
jgi:hypothetical protein